MICWRILVLHSFKFTSSKFAQKTAQLGFMFLPCLHSNEMLLWIVLRPHVRTVQTQTMKQLDQRWQECNIIFILAEIYKPKNKSWRMRQVKKYKPHFPISSAVFSGYIDASRILSLEQSSVHILILKAITQNILAIYRSIYAFIWNVRGKVC